MKGTLAGLCAVGVPSVLGCRAAGGPGTAAATVATSSDLIPRRTLGKTGARVSILGLGGDHVGRIRDDQEALRVVRYAIDEGITFLDTAWSYNAGRSEQIYGKALRNGYRDRIFLMTKVLGRTRRAAAQQLDESLRRLQVDHVDLWQLHAVNHENDPAQVLGPDGALEAAVKAQKDGKTRFIGFTGHRDPRLLLAMLDGEFPWDTIQMPVNPLDMHYRSFQRQILPIATQRGIAVIAMKTLSWGWLLRTGTVSADQALAYAWSQPVSLAVVGMDSMAVLKANIAASRSYRPMSRQQQQSLLSATRSAGSNGRYEPHKTAVGF
jgi:aryl-alcohol dehydrogenase-like predicted oxidoreductase